MVNAAGSIDLIATTAECNVCLLLVWLFLQSYIQFMVSQVLNHGFFFAFFQARVCAVSNE